MELFPEDADAFRFNSITSKDCMSVVNHSDAIALISSKGYITTTTPANTGTSYNFKVTYSPDDFFKNLLKEMQDFLLF